MVDNEIRVNELMHSHKSYIELTLVLDQNHIDSSVVLADLLRDAHDLSETQPVFSLIPSSRSRQY